MNGGVCAHHAAHTKRNAKCGNLDLNRVEKQTKLTAACAEKKNEAHKKNTEFPSMRNADEKRVYARKWKSPSFEYKSNISPPDPNSSAVRS